MNIPLREFGKAKCQVSALACGGHHLGDAADENTARRIVDQAIDGSVTFFDNCWDTIGESAKSGSVRL